MFWSRSSRTKLLLLVAVGDVKLYLYMLVDRIYGHHDKLSEDQTKLIEDKFRRAKAEFLAIAATLEKKSIFVPKELKEGLRLVEPDYFYDTTQVVKYFKSIDESLEKFKANC